MSAQTEREQEQIIGTVTGIVQKGVDKWQAVVAPDGSQYTKNLWTKDQALVASLTSQIGNRLAFLCNVSHWTNNQGQPIRSLWIEAAGSPGVGTPAPAAPPPQQAVPQPQPMAPMPQPQQHVVVQPQATLMGQPQPDLREQKIHRQTAAKVAATMLGYLEPGERNMSNLLVISERLVTYFDNGMPQTQTQTQTLEQELRQNAPHLFEGAAAQGEGYADVPPPPGDDDIPF